MWELVILENNKKENKVIGNFGEDIAAEFLRKNNYIILERNFICYYGEIDIIAMKEEEYIFCEVKTRRNFNYGMPIDAVNFYKKRHIWNCARYYLYKNGKLNNKIRFDIIEIYLKKKSVYLNHMKNVILDN